MGTTLLDRIRIVLIEPSHPGNIGGVARAMKTMGLSSLVLVQPKRFPDPQADWRAAGALDVLDQTKVCMDLDTAIADCGFVAGTSARNRHVPWPIVSPAKLAEKLTGSVDTSKPVAILFGRETNGLNNEELGRCNVHVQIPSSAKYTSLNLAMAVQVVSYEIFKTTQQVVESPKWDRPSATAQEITDLELHWERVLESTGFFEPDLPRPAMVRLQRLLRRSHLDEGEVQILRGFLTHIEKRLESKSSD